MDDSREARVARTEALFREVNERIAENVHRFEGDRGDFVCECGDAECTHRISVPLDEYEQVRQEPVRFVVAPGHDDASVEATVRDHGSFQVVEKTAPVAAAVVRRLNPRAA